MQFADLKLSAPLLRALEIEGYKVATPIQAQAIPQILAGRDVLGSAQTGTGKTAAFALPILDRLNATPAADGTRRRIRCVVLCPTRELAAQIGTGFKAYGREVRVRYAVVFGGVSQHGQVESLRSGVDIVIATPGRFLDLMNQGHIDLSQVNTLVLDEADRMLDMGFIHDIRRVVAKLPHKRQTLLFSATMPHEIRKLADTILTNPITIAVAAAHAVADRIDESVYFVKREQKPQLLAKLVKELPIYRAIVFTRTKHGADRVVRRLEAYGISSAAIHGNKSQNNRKYALQRFKDNKIPLLVATDIASRGIDIDGITHVINYDLTHEPETYVHRIGRTARAGASGNAISFCDHEEKVNLIAIERLIKRKIGVVATPDGLFAPGASDGGDRDRDDDRPRRAPRQERSAAPRAYEGRSHDSHQRSEPAAKPALYRPNGPKARPAATAPSRPQHPLPKHFVKPTFAKAGRPPASPQMNAGAMPTQGRGVAGGPNRPSVKPHRKGPSPTHRGGRSFNNAGSR